VLTCEFQRTKTASLWSVEASPHHLRYTKEALTHTTQVDEMESAMYA
jgi:hypothetical protein